MPIEYKQIPAEFKHRGWIAKLVKRTKNVAMYSKAGGYEVMKIRRHEGYEIANNKYPPSEFLPSDAEWGKFGWYYAGPNAKRDADKKFNELTE